jgi:hypothetical protein
LKTSGTEVTIDATFKIALLYDDLAIFHDDELLKVRQRSCSERNMNRIADAAWSSETDIWPLPKKKGFVGTYKSMYYDREDGRCDVLHYIRFADCGWKSIRIYSSDAAATEVTCIDSANTSALAIVNLSWVESKERERSKVLLYVFNMIRFRGFGVSCL